MGLLLTVDGQASQVEDFEFSNVDPGGFEFCSFELQQAANPGARVQVTDGMAPVWDGFVEAPGQRQTQGRISASGQAVGAGALLDDLPFTMIYRDSALNAWTNPASVQRQINLADNAGGYIVGDQGSVEVVRDTATGRPSLVLKFTNTVTTAARHPILEGWYDAGAGNLVDRVGLSYRSYDKSAGGLNALAGSWVGRISLSSDDIATVTTTATLGSSGTVDLPANGAYRYALAQLFYNAVTATGAGDWRVMLDDVRVYGPHGLADTDAGLMPGDIVKHALRYTGAKIAEGTIESGLPFLVRQLVYKDQAVGGSTVIGDVAKLTALHWGVWGPSALDDLPVLDFRARPQQPTAVVRRADCAGLEIEERVSTMFDEMVGRYTDPAQGPGIVTARREHARLPVGRHRRKIVDLGSATAASAQVSVNLLLALDQAQSRGSGPVLLPSTVGTLNSGRRPAHLLRAGLDRLKIVDAQMGGPVLDDSGTVLMDTFRVKRVSVSVKAGQPHTTVEIDQGADLLETLNARLAELEALVGV